MNNKINGIFNLEAERIVLGSIIQDNTLEGLEGANIEPQDYFLEAHRIVYLAILDLNKENKAIDIINITEKLKQYESLEEIGGISGLTSLTTAIPHNANIKSCIDTIKECSNKRQLVQKLSETIENIVNINTENILETLDEAKSIVENTTRFESMFSNFADIEIKRDTKSLPTGFLRLDRATHGLEYGTLTTLTGEPATGKSTILNQIIANTISNGEKVFLYSGELPQRKIKYWFNRTVANEEHLKEIVDEYGKEKTYSSSYANELISKWANNKLFIFNDEQRPSESNLIGSITYLAKNKGVRLVILDNLMTMITDDPTDNEYQKQKYLVNNLKNLAKRYDLVIILVAHANKKSRETREHNMFDVSGASEIVNLSDYVFKTIRQIEKDEAGNITSQENYICILKNRIEGIQGVSLKTYFDDRRKRFYTDSGNELKKDYGYNASEQQEFKEKYTEEYPF